MVVNAVQRPAVILFKSNLYVSSKFNKGCSSCTRRPFIVGVEADSCRNCGNFFADLNITLLPKTSSDEDELYRDEPQNNHLGKTSLLSDSRKRK